MDELSGASSLALYSQSENQTVTDERRKIRKQKDGKAIAELRDKIPDIDNIFDIHGRIGTGTFSTVMLATLKCEVPLQKERRRMFAIKHLIPTSHPIRVEKELKCLIEIGGADNVAGIDLCLRRRESVAFVMPYLPHDRFQDYFDKMEPKEVQNYIKNLLIALKRVHSFNVIHRDVKPSNFLYNRKLGRFLLVDFGLAQNVNRTETSPSNAPSNNNIVSGKRKMSLNDSLEGGDIKRVRDNENNAIACNPKSPGSPFKMPLKQINEIITPKSSLNCLRGSTKLFDSPLTRQVKSAVLGASMTYKLQQKLSKASNNSQQSPTSKGTEGTSSLSHSKYNTNRNLSSSSTTSKCYCYGKNQVCNICLIKREIPASRAGTPGYRPPEVLLKYTDQTTAVDLWAVGVIFISILSAVYPFFKAPDDFVALAEIVTIFGDEAIRRTAYALSRHVCMSHHCKPLDLKKLCVRLRNRFQIIRVKSQSKLAEECTNCQQLSVDCLCVDTKHKVESAGIDIFPQSAYDLLARLLEINPHKRITAEEALNHPFFSEKFV